MLVTRPISKAVPDCDINLFIVRSAKGVPRGFKHILQLSPSMFLFQLARKWKQEGRWPEMFPKYKEIFESNMLGDMKPYLDRIEMRLKEGKSVQLVCYCPDVQYCHRGIIVDYFINKGYEVIKE